MYAYQNIMLMSASIFMIAYGIPALRDGEFKLALRKPKPTLVIELVDIFARIMGGFLIVLGSLNLVLVLGVIFKRVNNALLSYVNIESFLILGSVLVLFLILQYAVSFSQWLQTHINSEFFKAEP